MTNTIPPRPRDGQVVLQGRTVLGTVAGATHIPVTKLQDVVSGEIVGQANVLRITVAPEERELRGAITSTLHRMGMLQALAVGALVGLFLTAGIALALLRPRARHVDSGWE
jgi:hypothetical protein